MRQTSRMYGIKVKEQISYYPYNKSTKSEGIDDIILSFEDGYWIVTSNYDNVWMNGVQYTEGEEIVRFEDGLVSTYRIMAQYIDEIPYKNYFYYIYSNAAVNPNAGSANIQYQIIHESEDDYEFKILKKVNGLITSTKTVTSENVRKYKNTYNKNYYSLSSYHLLVDFHGQDPNYPPYSFTIISNSNYILDENGNPKGINSEICTFRSHSAPYFSTTITDETQKHQAAKNSEELPSVQLIKKLNGRMQGTVHEFTRESIFHDVYYDHKDVFYNGKHHKAMFLVYDNTGVNGCWTKKIESIALTYADPFWFLMTTKAGIEYGGRTLEARKLIKTWRGTESINLSFSQTKSRKKVAPDDAPFDDIIYDVLSTSENVTVTKIIAHKWKDSEGRTHTDETPEGDPIVFTTSDAPVTCWNIQFRLSSTTWTIFSKCGYIRYGGRQYSNNRSILSFEAGEDMHIEIKDETNKYEVEDRIVYTIDNEQSAAINYKIWTPLTDPVIKVEKSVNGVAEPWTTIHYYDANILPFEMDDFLFDFDMITKMWTLTSSSDTLYSDGTNYKAGEVISEWAFTTKVKLSHIVVLTNSEENNIRVQTRSIKKSGKNNVDIDELVPSENDPDLQVLHSATKQLWEIRSVSDDTYSNGVQYLTGQTIFSVKDKVIVDPFTIMVVHREDAEGHPIIPYDNRLYSVSFSYDPINDISSILVVPEHGSSWSRNNKEKDPGNTTYVFNKNNLKSMYGYIWRRETAGPGPDWDYYSIFVPNEIYDRITGYYDYNIFCIEINQRIGKGVNISTRYSSGYYYFVGRSGSCLFFKRKLSETQWRLAYTDNYGRTWTECTGLETNADPILVVNSSSIICDKNLDGYTFVFQEYSILEGELTKESDNICEHGRLYPEDSGTRITINNGNYIFVQSSVGGFHIFDIENNIELPVLTTLNNLIQAENQERARTYNYTRREGNIVETQTINDFSISGMIHINDRTLFYCNTPIKCIREVRNLSTGTTQTYTTFDWEICYYYISNNGTIGGIVTGFASETDKISGRFYVEYESEYYSSVAYNTDNDKNTRIFKYSDGHEYIVKTINRENLDSIRIKVYTSSTDYEWYTLYFGDISFNSSTKVYGIDGAYVNDLRSLGQSGDFYIVFRTVIDQSYYLFTFFDNPLLNESDGNFAIFGNIN